MMNFQLTIASYKHLEVTQILRILLKFFVNIDAVPYLLHPPPPNPRVTLYAMLQRLVAMNMPLKPDGTVTFTATLFAVIRTSLRIKMDGSIDSCNRELKGIVQKIWKRAPDSVLDAIFPPAGTGKIEFYAMPY